MSKTTSHGDGAAAPYVVLARKYRPQTFEDLIGQEAMVRTLRNAFSTGRIAQAYMLTGVRGVGKTTTARILARALNYVPQGKGETQVDGRAGEPTVDMPALGVHCAEIIESRHPDVVEMDAASNTGVDNVREIIESARYRPVAARYKVFIIDEVHMLSKGAFNALLKTLEEPPAHVKFVFATTEVRKVPVTVLSRCQRFDLRRVDGMALAKHFGSIVKLEGGAADDDALALIARASEGSVRDGLSILDQALAIGDGRINADDVRAMLGLADRSRVFELLEVALSGDGAGALDGLAALHGDGAEPVQVLADLADAAHTVARAKVAGADGAGEMLSAGERERAADLAGRLSLALITRAWQTLVKGVEDAGRAPDGRAAADMVLIRLAYMAQLPGPEELARLVGELRDKEGIAAPPAVEPGRTSPSRTVNQNPAAGEHAEAALAAQRAHSVRQDENHNDAEADAPPRDAAPLEQNFNNRFTSDSPGPELWDSDLDMDDDPGAVRPVETVVADIPVLASFEDVIDFVGTKRDIMLKLNLEEKARLVHFEPGRIEMSVDDGAPPQLAVDLARRLQEWTGTRWMVALSRGTGGQTLNEKREEQRERDEAVIEADPVIKAMRAHFPDATIRDIKPLDVDERGGGDAATDAKTSTATGAKAKARATAKASAPRKKRAQSGEKP